MCVQQEMTLEEYEAATAEKRNAFKKQPTKPTNNNKEDFSGKQHVSCYFAIILPGSAQLTGHSQTHMTSWNLVE